MPLKGMNKPSSTQPIYLEDGILDVAHSSRAGTGGQRTPTPQATIGYKTKIAHEWSRARDLGSGSSQKKK
jgi:hypothetical protein